jgi:hypothetical protein
MSLVVSRKVKVASANDDGDGDVTWRRDLATVTSHCCRQIKWKDGEVEPMIAAPVAVRGRGQEVW